MLIPLSAVKNFEMFFWGESNPLVNYFVKIGANGYHKILIPTQHWKRTCWHNGEGNYNITYKFISSVYALVRVVMVM
jgi:hypothetical protein